jgi:hypothetical protein
LSEESTKSPATVVEDNIKRAENLLGGRDQLELAVEEFTARSDTETAVIVHAGRTKVRNPDDEYNQYSNFVSITSAVREALADPEEAIGAVSDNSGASLAFDLNGGAPGSVPAFIEMGEDAQTGTGLSRAIDGNSQRFQVRMPDTVLRELDIDPENADGERLILYAAEDHELPTIVFDRPEHESRIVEEPELIGQYDYGTRDDYIEVMQDAAAGAGEPLTVDSYRAWKQEVNPDAPTLRKITDEFGGFTAACEAAGIESGRGGGA